MAYNRKLVDSSGEVLECSSCSNYLINSIFTILKNYIHIPNITLSISYVVNNLLESFSLSWNVLDYSKYLINSNFTNLKNYILIGNITLSIFCVFNNLLASISLAILYLKYQTRCKTLSNKMRNFSMAS